MKAGVAADFHVMTHEGESSDWIDHVRTLVRTLVHVQQILNRTAEWTNECKRRISIHRIDVKPSRKPQQPALVAYL